MFHENGSRSKSFRVAGKVRAQTNIGYSKVQEYDAVKTNAAASVWVRAMAETLDVFRYALRRRAFRRGLFPQHGGIMNPLRTTYNLLSTDEHVVTVADFRVFRIRHGVEGPGLHGIFVHHEEIGAIPARGYSTTHLRNCGHPLM